jgi:hypothetical protein
MPATLVELTQQVEHLVRHGLLDCGAVYGAQRVAHYPILAAALFRLARLRRLFRPILARTQNLPPMHPGQAGAAAATKH